MNSPLDEQLVGTTVDQRYLVKQFLARGGMASVYLALDTRLDRDIALKVMHMDMADAHTSKDFVSRFRREARASARLTHPGLVRVYDQGVDGDLSYLTMEYVEGTTLRDYLMHEGTVPLAEAFAITESVLAALGAAHRQGLVHRDIKPENVLISVEGETKLADFGLARAATEVTSQSSGSIMGTVAYLAPELVTTGSSDARTDVYAAGIMLFEMITGRQPFTGDDPAKVAARHVNEVVPPPSSFVPWLPPDVDLLLSDLTGRDPDSRPADANEALRYVRQTAAALDPFALDRRADPPSGAFIVGAGDDTTALMDAVNVSRTIIIPIGIKRTAAAASGAAQRARASIAGARTSAPQSRGVLWTAAAAAAAVVLTLLGLWWYTSVGPGAYTTVPQVVGVTVPQAESTLATQGLHAEVIEVYDNEITKGLVISSDPEADARVSNGGTVTLTVSLGAQMGIVPTVIGITEADALSALAAAGFTFEPSVHVYDDAIPSDEVISVTPEAGTQVRLDTAVVLTVSDGPEPISIPDVTTMDELDALETLAGYALDVVVVHERTDSAAKGVVFAQTPVGGTAGFRTDPITIWVSDGPTLIKVPDYTLFFTPERAKKEAEELGLTVELKPRWPWSTQGTITGQSLAPGTVVEKGSKIILEYDT